jgi:hypothetical protein
MAALAAARPMGEVRVAVVVQEVWRLVSLTMIERFGLHTSK